MKIAIPTKSNKGLEDIVSDVFGKAKTFTILEVCDGSVINVETVDNPADALKEIESQRYDLIMLDIKMPGINGMELYRRIQKIDKSLGKKVVFITGDVMEKNTISFLSRTKAPYITKPFDIDEMMMEIGRKLIQK